MKHRTHILLGLVVILASSCKVKKAVIVPDNGQETIIVETKFTEMHCGGAAPPPEVIEIMMTPRILANTVLYLATMEQNITESTEIKTDKAGIFTVTLDTGMYRLFLKDPVVFSNLTEESSELEKCEQQWQMQNSFPLRVRKGVKPPMLIINKMCNPCEEPKP